MNVLALICVLLVTSCVHSIALNSKDDSDDNQGKKLDSNKPISVAAVGRAAQIGELYDARKDQFVRLQLFNEVLPEKTIHSTENWHTKLKLTLDNSLEDKFTLMDISASLKISIMSGLFNLEGSGKFFKDTKKSAKSAKATLIYSITTKYEQINMISSAIKPLIDLDALNDINCTHVVVGIQWGGNAFISVEDSNQENEDTRVIEGSLKVDLDQLSVAIHGEGSVNVSDVERQKYSKFNFEIFGDILPDKVPSNLVDAVAFMKDVPTRIQNANNGRGKAMTYNLVPISLLRRRFGEEYKLDSMIKDINDATVKKVTKLFDDLNTAQAELNDLMNRIKRYEPYILSDQIKALYDLNFGFKILQSEAQKSLAKHLIAVRSGMEETNELETVLTDFTNRLENNKQNKITTYNVLKPALKFVEFLQKYNVTLLKKTEMFRQFLREHFGEDIYILFYKLSDRSDANEKVINLFQTMLNKRKNFGKARFVGISYELLNESKFPVVIDRDNKTKIRLYRDNNLLADDFTPGQNVGKESQHDSGALYHVQQNLNNSRTKLDELKGNYLALLNKTLHLVQDQLELLNNPIPIGFMYIQLPFQKSPQELWTSCKFEDVTKQYAGKFFRAEGGTEPFGNLQFENSPRLTDVMFMEDKDAGNWEAKITPGQWSPTVTSGNRDGRWVSMKFLVRDAEVRPINYAVKIFKNVGCEKDRSFDVSN